MQIVPIHEITVSDTAKLGGRGKRTLVSLIVDGVTVYSKSVVGLPVLNCGTNTMGAFHNDKKESLFAWIDPVSKEFLITSDAATETVRPYMLLPGLALIAVVAIAKLAGLWTELPFLNMFPLLIILSALIALAFKKRADRKLEKVLRNALSV